MGLLNWFITKVSLIQKNSVEGSILALRREIEKLKRENKELKEKVIVLPKKNNEEIPIKFYDENDKMQKIYRNNEIIYFNIISFKHSDF